MNWRESEHCESEAVVKREAAGGRHADTHVHIGKLVLSGIALVADFVFWTVVSTTRSTKDDA